MEFFLGLIIAGVVFALYWICRAANEANRQLVESSEIKCPKCRHNANFHALGGCCENMHKYKPVKGEDGFYRGFPGFKACGCDLSRDDVRFNVRGIIPD